MSELNIAKLIERFNARRFGDYTNQMLWQMEAEKQFPRLIERITELEAENARLRVDAGQLWKALNDLSFECDGVVGTVKPTVETYNRTFGVMDSMREKYAAMQSHSANTVGGPTPVMDAAPACERKE